MRSITRRAALAMVLVGACALGAACAKSLASLAPFPCADDNTCPEGFACGSIPDASTPQCTMVCDAGLTGCQGECLNLMGDDPANCGGCGVACAEGAVCCRGQCAVLSSDPSHCGSCDTACEGKKSCVEKKCECLSTETVCSGVCADLDTDPHHCGSCDHDCGNGYCLSGTCHACKAYEMGCGGGCVTNNDPNNCGTCGASCGGQPCTGGVCGSQQCLGQQWTCINPADVFYCGSSTGGCCAADHPYFCDNALAPCWSDPGLDCSTITNCGGQYFACTAGHTYDCASSSCK
jgi:hypothetical protein